MKKIMFNDRYGLTQAVLDCRKTMTRRPCKDTKTNQLLLDSEVDSLRYYPDENLVEAVMRKGGIKVAVPQYKVGEIVAVAQNYKDVYDSIKNPCELFSDRLFNSLLKEHKGWNNKMFVKAEFMPHRIIITDIKVERMQDISDEDVYKEGIKKYGFMTYHLVDIKTLYEKSYRTPREAFSALIDRVSGRDTWDRNPWVFAYSFELIK